MTKEMIKQIENDYWREKADPIDMIEVFDLAQKAIEEPKADIKLTNSEWVDFLSKQFDISRTSAKEMLHVIKSSHIVKTFQGLRK